MKYEFKPSFDKSVKSLPPEIQQEVKELCIAIIDIFSGERKLSVGMGLSEILASLISSHKELLLGNMGWKEDARLGRCA